MNSRREQCNALYYFNILDTGLTLILPILLVTVMNCMIARAIYLFYARNKEQRRTQDFNQDWRGRHGSSPNQRNSNLAASRIDSATATSGGSSAHAAQSSVTRTLLLVSTVFVLLNLPSYVMRIYVFLLLLGHSPRADPEVNSVPYVLQRYFMLLYYTNFAINFVLYNTSSSVFRASLRDCALRCWATLLDSLAELRSTMGIPSSTIQYEDTAM
ncbi:hypothetical protein HPB49_021528 [Dermacentor silvarum]|uniref:Uncharacterized protein n=1 Tax=Dermacentor silvarum TaxID=543639 RepID=A0ACB8C5H2_DERSI|nr:hypothetical protein HPB49_021528 [Dermacentor silvarum]